MVFKDYYKILDLETSRVSSEQIKVAYRAAAKKYHPDVNVGDTLAEEKIKDINEAYRILSTPSTKRKYDRVWNTHHIAKTKKTFNIKKETGSILNMFLGKTNMQTRTVSGEKKEPIRGENVETEIKVGIRDAYYGLDKKISLRTIEGKMKTFTVTVPKGIRDGEKIRLIGQGKPGKDGGKNGDLLIRIKIQDEKGLQLKGYDLYTNLMLTPWEAALGTRTNISSVDEETKIYIPQGIQSGEKIRIPKKGYPDGNGSRGDLIAEIKKLNEISSFNPRNI